MNVNVILDGTHQIHGIRRGAVKFESQLGVFLGLVAKTVSIEGNSRKSG